MLSRIPPINELDTESTTGRSLRGDKASSLFIRTNFRMTDYLEEDPLLDENYWPVAAARRCRSLKSEVRVMEELLLIEKEEASNFIKPIHDQDEYILLQNESREQRSKVIALEQIVSELSEQIDMLNESNTQTAPHEDEELLRSAHEMVESLAAAEKEIEGLSDHNRVLEEHLSIAQAHLEQRADVTVAELTLLREINISQTEALNKWEDWKQTFADPVIAEKDERISQLNMEISNLTETLKVSKNEEIQSLLNQVSQLQSQLDEKTSEISLTCEKNQILNESFDKATRNEEILKTVISQKDLEISNLTAEITNLQSEKETIEFTITGIQSKNTENLKTSEMEIKALANQIDQLENSVKEKDVQLLASENEISNLKDEMIEHSEFIEEISRLQAALILASDDAATLAEASREGQEEISRLQARLGETDNERKGLFEKISTLEQAISDWESWKEEVAIRDLEVLSDKLQKVEDELKDERNNLISKMNDLQEQEVTLNILTKENEKLEEDLEESTNSYNEMVNEFSSKQVESNETMSDLKKKIDDSQEQKDKLIEQFKHLESELIKSQKKLSEIQHQTDDKVSTLQTNLERALTDLSDACDAKRIVETNLSSLETELADLHSQLNAQAISEDKIDKLETQLNTMRKSEALLTLQLEEKAVLIETLKAQMETMLTKKEKKEESGGFWSMLIGPDDDN